MIKDYNINKPDEFPIQGEGLMKKLEEIIVYFNWHTNRLKTLEEKIEFIMEFGRGYKPVILGEGSGATSSYEIVKLKDLYDEENEPNFEEIRIKNKEIADEMLNNEPSVNTELLEEEAKHGYGHACSIYSGINCSYCGRKAIKSFVEEDHNMKISTATMKMIGVKY